MADREEGYDEKLEDLPKNTGDEDFKRDAMVADDGDEFVEETPGEGQHL